MQQGLNHNEKDDTSGEAKPRQSQNGFVHMMPQRAQSSATRASAQGPRVGVDESRRGIAPLGPPGMRGKSRRSRSRISAKHANADGHRVTGASKAPKVAELLCAVAD